MLVPLPVAWTSEMHDILVAMQRNNSGGRQETTREAAKNWRNLEMTITTMGSLMFNACYQWHDCCNDTYTVVEIPHQYTTAVKCPIPTISTERITGSQRDYAQTSEQDRTSLIQ
jgi:hypothetical protein